MHPDQRADLYFVQHGQRVSFQVVYEQHWQMLCGIGDKFTHDEELTHDLVQEVFLSLIEKANGKELDNISGYLVRAMKFKCLSHLRNTRVAQRYLSRFEQVRHENSIENDLHVEDLQARLDLILQEMPEREQEIFKMSRFEDLSTDEIAERLGLNKRTVENYLSRAVQTLRLTLKSVPFISLLDLFR